jgi:trehalose 6-phosphate synthase/phosphatase
LTCKQRNVYADKQKKFNDNAECWHRFLAILHKILCSQHRFELKGAGMERKLIIVSNRLPFQIKKKEGRFEVTQSAGGLVSAMNSIPRENNMIWIGAADFPEEVWKEYCAGNPNNDVQIVPVFLEKKTESLYYNGFSNTLIWPLFHYFPNYAEYDEAFYTAYRKVNYQFAEVIENIATPDDIVWVHDYHLMLVPGFLKKGKKQFSCSFFLHIPFPSYELMKLIPEDWRNEILNSLLCNDVLGFHTHEYTSHFKRSISFFLGIESMNNTVTLNNHLTLIKDYPISIDFQKFNDAFDDPEVVRGRKQIRRRYEGEKIIFSLDRLDYSKGVINRLQAFENLLEKHPEQKTRIVFLINVIPSREKISAYAERKRMIEENISRINGVYGTVHWQPIIYRYQSLSFQELVACYTSCDVALVTPLRDGMNLVAKEFVASRKDQKGVLILSEFAGAALELTSALMVNPNDVHLMQSSMLQAIKLEESEQKARMSEMQQVVKTNDVNKWTNSFLEDIRTSKASSSWSHPNIMSYHEKIEIFEAYHAAKRRLIVLDYDGTLIPYYNKPQDAVPGDVLKDLVNKVAKSKKNKVLLISGRDPETLETWFKSSKIDIAAEHGIVHKAVDQKEWCNPDNVNLKWKAEVKTLIEKFVASIPGSFIEEKKYSIAWHYRAIENIDEETVKLNLSKELMMLNVNNEFDILHGNKVIEIKSAHTNKGKFVMQLMAQEQFDFVLAIGDDTTDEDMFNVLKEPYHYTVKVGLAQTSAKYNLVSVSSVRSFLDQMCSPRITV